MKKIASLFLCFVLISMLLPLSSLQASSTPVKIKATENIKSEAGAASAPVYDATFNNNQGALFANGTPITLQSVSGNTVATWSSGSQNIPSSTIVFGGGIAGSTFSSSDITMLSGTVRSIYGGGFSLDENAPALVSDASITVFGGTVSASLYGGGLLYAEVLNASILVDNGTLRSVAGGGAASASINGQSYNSGTSTNPELSGTRVDSANITINGGNIFTLWGGGQGYSYTGSSSISILGGFMDYVTAGGSNGLTESIKVNIRGGNIVVYQSVNRGLVNAVETTVSAGNIDFFYVGGETVSDVTGTIDAASINILGGTITTLNAGTSGGLPLNATLPEYEVLFVAGSVIDNQISQGAESITVTLSFAKERYKVRQRTPLNLPITITTNPSGYESLFSLDQITYTSSDDTLVMVNSKGTIIGLRNGTATITASLLDQQAETEVKVHGIPTSIVIQFLFIGGLALLLGILFIITINLERIICHITRSCR